MCPMLAFIFGSGIGYGELLLFLLVALLLFGNRLPTVMRSFGKSIVEFKKGVQGIEDEVDDAVNNPKKVPPPKE